MGYEKINGKWVYVDKKLPSTTQQTGSGVNNTTNNNLVGNVGSGIPATSQLTNNVVEGEVPINNITTPETSLEPTINSQDEILQFWDENRQKQIAQEELAYKNIVSGIQSQKTDIENYYTQQKSDTLAQGVINLRGLREQQAMSGRHNTGMGETARLMYDIEMKRYMRTLSGEEQSALNTLTANINQATLQKQQSILGIEQEYAGKKLELKQQEQQKLEQEQLQQKQTTNNLLNFVNENMANLGYEALDDIELQLQQQLDLKNISQETYDYLMTEAHKQGSEKIFEGLTLADAEEMKNEILADTETSGADKELYKTAFDKYYKTTEEYKAKEAENNLQNVSMEIEKSVDIGGRVAGKHKISINGKTISINAIHREKTDEVLPKFKKSLYFVKNDTIYYYDADQKTTFKITSQHEDFKKFLKDNGLEIN